MSTALEYIASSGLGGAVVLLVRAGAKWLRVRSIANRVRREAREGPEFGTNGWLYNEILRERGARHALQRELQELREWAAHFSGLQATPFRGLSPRHDSGEQERVDFDRERRGSRPSLAAPVDDNETEPDPLPAFGGARTGRRSRS